MTDNNSGGKQSDSVPLLNPNAATFVPSFVKKPAVSSSDQSQGTSAALSASFNINAPVFKPIKPNANRTSGTATITNQINTNTDSQTNINATSNNFNSNNISSSFPIEALTGLAANINIGGNQVNGNGFGAGSNGNPLQPGIDALNGYVNPFAAKSQQQQLLQKKKQLNKKEELKKKIYPLEFLLSFRNQYKDRPVNMALLDFPHKRRRN